MKKYILFLSLTIVSWLSAQVGINTSTPLASMDVRTGNHNTAVTAHDGVLVPRVNSLVMNGSVSGQLVYLTSDSTPYTKGFYFWNNAEAKWIKVGSGTVDATKDAWINDTFNTTVKLGTLSDGVTARPNDATVGIKDNGSLGIGNLDPQVKLDIRRAPVSYMPGNGSIAIGNSSTNANRAGAGAIRYNGSKLQYSDGTSWQELKEGPLRAMVVAKKVTTQSIPGSTVTTHPVTDWSEELDLTGNFDPASGVFTSPRPGYYLVSFGYSFTHGGNIARSRSEAILQRTNSAGNILEEKKAITSHISTTANEGGASVTFVFLLNTGDKVRPIIWHNTTNGTDRELRVLKITSSNNPSDDGFVNFNVKELY